RPAPGGGGGGASAAGGDLRGRGKREEGRVRGARVAQWLWGGAPLARVARLPLVPLAALYWGATRVRAAVYRAGWRHVARLPFPTVAVGNLSVGGTGKTPLAAWVARDLNIAVVSAESVGLSLWPLPAGPWREGSDALERADLIVVTRKRAPLDAAAGVADWLARRRRETPVCVAHLALSHLEGLRS